MRSILMFAALTAVAPPLAAQGWIEPDRPHPDWGVARVRTTVSVRVAGRIAHVEVEDWFENRGPRPGEGDYHYALPGEAVFANVSLFQGDRELRGETMDVATARRIYEDIVRRRKDPALIELAGHGLLRARVFPINPGETRKLTLRYTQVLERAGDALAFRYLAGRGGAAPVAVTVTAEDAGRFADPFSPTHRLETTRRGGRMTVRIPPDAPGDLTLFLPLARPTVGLTLAAHRTDAEAGYFMLTLSPGTSDGPGAARDLTVVVDVSGSMSGSKLGQARAALHQLLGTLDARDRFRLVRFSSRVATEAPGWTPATPDALRRARAWVDALAAEGGTDIAGALEEAFRLPPGSDRLPIVVFLTDGLPSVGERDPERIADAAAAHRGQARVFAFGIGHDVNTYLLDRLSAAGRGATQYVAPGEDVEAALGTLAAKIRHPVLTDLQLAADVRLREIYPRTLPDLFHGEELIVLGRYEPAGPRESELRVTGRRNGRTERYAVRAAFPEHTGANDFIPRLWASRKLGALQQTVRLEGAREELIEEIRRTALRYGLLSEYTAYLVQEPDVLAGRGGDGAPMTPAPSAQLGAASVARASGERRMREAATVLDVAAADEALKNRMHGPDARAVAGRWFVERDGVWTDLRRGTPLRTVTVAPFSDAYFTLMERLPELVPYVTAFEQVQVAGERVAIRVAPDGVATLADPDRVVREFRGP